MFKVIGKHHTFSSNRKKIFQGSIRSYFSKIKFNSNDDLIHHQELITKNFKEKGFCILANANNFEENLIQVSTLFGTIQRSQNSDKNGATLVSSMPDNHNFMQGVFSNAEFFAHTDGAYLNGLIETERKIIKNVTPPKLVMLQCVTQADTGGETLLYDAKNVLATFIKNHPETLQVLFKKGCINFIHGNILGRDLSIFDMESKKIKVKFSQDHELIVPKWAIKEVMFFCQEVTKIIR